MRYFNNRAVLGIVFVAAFAADVTLADESALQPGKSAFESEIRADIDVQRETFTNGFAVSKRANLISSNERVAARENSIYFSIVPDHNKVNL